jgi:hypothetical protein
MALGLTALGEGRMPARMRLEASAAHSLGGVIGGGVVAAGLWLAATPIRTLFPSPVPELVVSIIAIAAVAIDANLLKLQNRSGQVPAVWYGRYGPQRSYAMYGFLFGAGFATLRPHAVIYTVFAALALLAPLPAAALGGAVFGLGRTVVIGPASLRATAVSWLLYRSPRVHRVWSAVSIVLSVALLWVAIATAGAIRG